MNNLSLKHLQTFVAIIEAGSLRRASEVLHLSQPAVTLHLKQLEQAVGMSLVDRTTRRMRITSAGERLRSMAEQTIGQMEAVVGELRNEAALRRGHIVISCVPTVAASLLPLTLTRFERKFPEITVKVFDVIAEQIFAQLVDGNTDFGIGPRPTDRLEFDFESLISDPFVVVVPRKHPWSLAKSVSLYDLVDAPFLALLRGYNVRETLDADLKKYGLKISPKLEVSHHYTLGGMVQAGLGITALPWTAVSMLSQPLLRTVPLANPGAAREIGIIKLRGRTLQPAQRVFIDAFRNIAVRHVGATGVAF